MSSSISSQQIKKLLMKKHKDDIFVNELGFSFENNWYKMDSWAMIRTSNLIVAYEIKVSHNDFVNDKKWHNYKEASNELCFVCPWELIQPEELPQDIGLIWVSKTGNRLMQKKQSVRHDINKNILEHCLKSILFNRATINPDRISITEDKKEFFTKWLENKEIDYRFGQMVSKSIQKTIKNKIDKLEKENRDLEYDIQWMKTFRESLLKMTGLSPDTDDWELVNRSRQLIESKKSDVSEWIKVKNIAEKMIDNN